MASKEGKVSPVPSSSKMVSFLLWDCVVTLVLDVQTMTDIDIMLHDHDIGHIIILWRSPTCSGSGVGQSTMLRSWSEPVVTSWFAAELQLRLRWCSQWVTTCQCENTSHQMYSYNVVYKDTEDDLMFAMEEDEMVRRHGGSGYKSSECLCCNSSQLLGAFHF